MEGVAVDLIDAGLRPAAAATVVLVHDRVDHVAHFEVAAPLLVGVAQTLEVFVGYQIVVLVQDGIIVEDVLHAVEKDWHVLTKL